MTDKYSRINEALEREIKSVENDSFLTPEQKSKAIARLEREAREMMRDEDDMYDILPDGSWNN